MGSSDARSSITITIVQASFPASSGRRQCIVEIDSKLHFPVLDKSSKFIITILCDNLLRCLGKIDIELEHLVKLQYLQPNEDVVLSLIDKKGNPRRAEPSLRIIEASTST
ncbi:hypothetical protein AX14_004394, partial [Amanita brunnescens Koide BX004]